MNRYQMQKGSMKKHSAITIRLPENMAAQIRVLAQQEHRSLNGTIVYLLSLALEPLSSYPEAATPVPEARLSPDSESGDSV